MRERTALASRLARRAASARARLVAMSVAGLSVFLLLPDAWPWFLQVLLAWDAAALVFLVPAVWLVVSADAAETRHLATRADPARASARLLLLAASSMSLVGVGRGLTEAGRLGGSLEVVLTVGSLLAVALSWSTLHMVYTLHYAHLYYRDGQGGVDFNQERDPSYREFLYLAFTVGMTYQVSDTPVTDTDLRFEITKHALLAFLFGTVIVAFSINMVAGLVK